MKKIRLIFLLGITLSGCTKQDLLDLFDRIPKPGTIYFDCVRHEEITDHDTPIQIYFPGDRESGYATAEKTNRAWNATAKVRFYSEARDTFSLDFTTYDGVFGYERESISLNFLTLTPGCRSITNYTEIPPTTNPTSGYAIVDGDAIEDYYDVDENAADSNRIEIIEVDPIERILRGRFSVSYIIWRKWNPDSPDRVRFFNGEFEVKLP